MNGYYKVTKTIGQKRFFGDEKFMIYAMQNSLKYKNSRMK